MMTPLSGNSASLRALTNHEIIVEDLLTRTKVSPGSILGSQNAVY
jgi:hypothetical protein